MYHIYTDAFNANKRQQYCFNPHLEERFCSRMALPSHMLHQCSGVLKTCAPVFSTPTAHHTADALAGTSSGQELCPVCHWPEPQKDRDLSRNGEKEMGRDLLRGPDLHFLFSIPTWMTCDYCLLILAAFDSSLSMLLWGVRPE